MARRRPTLDQGDQLTLADFDFFEEDGAHEPILALPVPAAPEPVPESDEDDLSYMEQLGFWPPPPLGPRPPDDQALMPEVLASWMSVAPTSELEFQYGSRSDEHSVVKCWGFLLDLMRICPELGTGLLSGTLVFGINSRHDGKALDLVIGRPARASCGRSMADFVSKYDIPLTPSHRAALDPFKHLREGVVDDAIVTLEAKGVMTAHGKALCRLRDELGARNEGAPGAVRVSLLMVNTSTSFISSDLNHGLPVAERQTTNHVQPRAALSVVPVARAQEAADFIVGIVFLSCANDGSPVTLPAFGPADLDYGAMVRRVSALCTSRLAA